MKNNKKTMGMMISILMVGLLVSVIVPLMTVRIGIASMVIIIAGIIWLTNRNHDIDYLQTSIRKRLMKHDCSCKIDDDLCVTDDNHKFVVKLMPEGKHLYRVHVMFRYQLSELEFVNEDGQDVLNGEANRTFPYTVVVRTPKINYCSYVGAIRTASDFMELYDRAKEHIFETMQWLSAHAEAYGKEYPTMSDRKDSKFWNHLSGLKNNRQRVVVKGFKKEAS